MEKEFVIELMLFLCGLVFGFAFGLTRDRHDVSVDNRMLADCKKRFAGSEPPPFSDFPVTTGIEVNKDNEQSKDEQLKKLMSETVVKQIKEMSQPGGLLYRK